MHHDPKIPQTYSAGQEVSWVLDAFVEQVSYIKTLCLGFHLKKNIILFSDCCKFYWLNS